jgi:hypothetical protein
VGERNGTNPNPYLARYPGPFADQRSNFVERLFGERGEIFMECLDDDDVILNLAHGTRQLLQSRDAEPRIKEVRLNQLNLRVAPK